jgi:malyl-CoA/(S)-citramalyl-CoA lyase
MKLPVHFYKPLAIGAPQPLRELPVRPERMIHFFPPHIDKIRAKAPETARQCDVMCGNLEDAIPIESKDAARAGFIDLLSNQRLRRHRDVGAHQCLEQPVGPRRP